MSMQSLLLPLITVASDVLDVGGTGAAATATGTQDGDDSSLTVAGTVSGAIGRTKLLQVLFPS